MMSVDTNSLTGVDVDSLSTSEVRAMLAELDESESNPLLASELQWELVYRKESGTL